MAEKFPAARIGVLDHLRKMLAHRDRQADRSRKTMLAHRLRHAPVADAIAIVAVAISDDVRVRPCPALAVRVGGRVAPVEFEEIGRGAGGDEGVRQWNYRG